MKLSKFSKEKVKEDETKPLLPSFTKPAVAKIRRCPTGIRKPAAAKPQSEDSGGTSDRPTLSSSGESSKNDSGQPTPPADSSQSTPQGRPRSQNKGLNLGLDDSHPRFGPTYIFEQSSIQKFKERAWMHLVKKSVKGENLSEEHMKKRELQMKEIYSSAIRKVEAEAKTSYGEKPGVIKSEFRWMLIIDGCFFLQLALLILGYQEQLNYPPEDPIFGQNQSARGNKKWIEAMFYSGNQIPLVVLRELMAQEFFKNIVLAKPRWNIETQSLCKKVFYELLVWPIHGETASNQSLSQNTVYQEASDILHGLRLLLLGSSVSENHLSDEYKRDADFDLEANKNALDNDDDDDDDEDDDDDDEDLNIEDGDEPGASSSDNSVRLLRSLLKSAALPRAIDEGRKRTFRCATDLKRGRIYIHNLDSPGKTELCFNCCSRTGSGIRGIEFRSRYLWASLYMPTLQVDPNTEKVLGNLCIYEKQRIKELQPEVSSYVRFMSDIVRTKRDVKLLAERGIIQGDPSDVDKLAGILNRLASEDIGSTHQLRAVRRQVRDYSSPWVHYKSVINVVVVLTLVQAVFAVLAYFRPPKP